MPMNQSGQYFSNPAVGAMHDKANAAAQPAAPAGPQAVKEITLCQYDDGSFGVKGDDGSETPAASLDEALSAAQVQFGGDQDGDEASQAPAAGGSDAQQPSGY